MKQKELFERLEAVKTLVARFPKDVTVNLLKIDWCSTHAARFGFVDQIWVSTDAMQSLVRAGVIQDGSWESEDDPEVSYYTDCVTVDGFQIISLRDKEPMEDEL